MDRITISRREFRDKVYACWLGKNIGGTLGAPMEGHKHTHALEFYEPLPSKAAPNDDLDLQLVWLQVLEEQGIDPAVTHLADYWVRYADAYPWDEYGFFMRNAAMGLRPPIAGCFENYYIDNMGSPIRSEIWAVLHAGNPQAAARMAWKDSAVDHAGGEGTWGEMFWAALQAAAFVESDPLTLIRIGLSMIPISSQVSRAIREVLWCRENGMGWGYARERVTRWFQQDHPCSAMVNHGYTIIGWLYGKDFGDRLCKAVNCGFDTDCTGATLGATLGILGGTAGIPEKWRAPVGEQIVLHKFTRLPSAPKTLSELTERSIALAEKAAAGGGEVAFGEKTLHPADLRSRLFRNELAIAARAQDVHAAVEPCAGAEVTLHYNGDPVLFPGIAREVRVTAPAGSTVELSGPAGWKIERLGGDRFRLLSEGAVEDKNTLTVSLGKGRQCQFRILGPGMAKGFPAGTNVPRCPKCQGRVESCLCGEKKA